jgi:hypothetical protein
MENRTIFLFKVFSEFFHKLFFVVWVDLNWVKYEVVLDLGSRKPTSDYNPGFGSYLDGRFIPLFFSASASLLYCVSI